MWVPVSKTDKVSCQQIRNLRFKSPTYTKNQLVSWPDDKEKNNLHLSKKNYKKFSIKKNVSEYLHI